MDTSYTYWLRCFSKSRGEFNLMKTCLHGTMRQADLTYSEYEWPYLLHVARRVCARIHPVVGVRQCSGKVGRTAIGDQSALREHDDVRVLQQESQSLLYTLGSMFQHLMIARYLLWRAYHSRLIFSRSGLWSSCWLPTSWQKFAGLSLIPCKHSAIVVIKPSST